MSQEIISQLKSIIKKFQSGKLQPTGLTLDYELLGNINAPTKALTGNLTITLYAEEEVNTLKPLIEKET